MELFYGFHSRNGLLNLADIMYSLYSKLYIQYCLLYDQRKIEPLKGNCNRRFSNRRYLCAWSTFDFILENTSNKDWF